MADAITNSGIRTRTYKSQAIVYFEGDKSESIFILKKGRVLLTYLKPETGEEVKEDIRPGEFFGVKSALGRYPREETAQTIGETTILILSPPDFERLVLANLGIVKKMLRVFSNQLRRVHRAVREVMGDPEITDPASELFKIGEHYTRSGKYEQAIYAYKKYMEHYPDGKFAATAMKKIRSIESGDYNSASTPGIPMDEPAAMSPTFEGLDATNTDEIFGGSGEVMDEFGSSAFGESADDLSFDSGDEGFGDFVPDNDPDNMTELSNELDSFVSSDLNDDLLDDFGLDDGGGESDQAKLSQARSLMEGGEYDKAAAALEELKNSSSPENEDINHAAIIELAICKKQQNKLQEALSELSLFVKNNAQSSYVKAALFEAGDVYLQAGSVDKAKAYLKKVASMQPRDELTQKALGLLKENKFS